MEVMGYDLSEINPYAWLMGILASIVVLIVMKQVNISIIWRILGAIVGFLAGVVYTQIQANKE